jgi:hypothetical protein
MVRINLNRDKLSGAMKAAVKAIFSEAAVKFLETVAPAIPVDTGMARGSFLNMLALLENKGYTPDVDIPSQPQRTKKDGRPYSYKHTDGRRMPKTPRQGALLSTKKSQIIRFVDNRIQVEFNSQVKHLNLNERLATRVPGTPWMAFSRGRDKFLKEIRSAKGAIPELTSYLVMTTLTVGEGSPFKVGFRERKQRKF